MEQISGLEKIKFRYEEAIKELERRRQSYLAILNDPRRKQFDRDIAQSDLDEVEIKIAALREKQTPEDPGPNYVALVAPPSLADPALAREKPG